MAVVISHPAPSSQPQPPGRRETREARRRRQCPVASASASQRQSRAVPASACVSASASAIASASLCLALLQRGREKARETGLPASTRARRYLRRGACKTNHDAKPLAEGTAIWAGALDGLAAGGLVFGRLPPFARSGWPSLVLSRNREGSACLLSLLSLSLVSDFRARTSSAERDLAPRTPRFQNLSPGRLRPPAAIGIPSTLKSRTAPWRADNVELANLSAAPDLLPFERLC